MLVGVQPDVNVRRFPPQRSGTSVRRTHDEDEAEVVRIPSLTLFSASVSERSGVPLPELDEVHAHDCGRAVPPHQFECGG
jgi:hypothetical protein